MVVGAALVTSGAIPHITSNVALTAPPASIKCDPRMSELEPTLSPRYEVRVHWEGGTKRFAVHDLQQSDHVVQTFDSVKEASINCALLWLDHVRAMRGGSTGIAPLASFPSQRFAKRQ
jgi:hypothetical protein